MRLKIELSPSEQYFTIPVNYNYLIASVIYKLFSQGSKEFSEWLHAEGYVSTDGKPMRLFNFSKLNFEDAQIENNLIHAYGKTILYFSSPIIEKHVNSIIRGALGFPLIEVASHMSFAKFKILKVSVIPEPHFADIMSYKMISPTVVTTMIETEKGLVVHNILPDEKIICDCIVGNIKRKFEMIHHQNYEGPIQIIFDQTYIESKGGYNKISKLITLREGYSDQTKIKCFICPVKVIAEPIIQKLIYDCGIGNKNSMGFGMLSVR